MKPSLFCCMALALSACAQPLPAALMAPTDPSQGLAKPRAVSVTADSRTYKIEEPLAWDELNRRVTPKETSR